MQAAEMGKAGCLRSPGLSANRRDSLMFEGRRASMSVRRESLCLSLQEHAQMNRVTLEEVGAGLKSNQAREESALSCIRKVICGFLVRKNICNLVHCDDLLRQCQFFMRHTPRVGIYFRFCLSFFKHHVLYFRLKNVAGLAYHQFVRCCIVKDFDCGAVVCRQGDSCDFFYVLIEGQMTITQRLGHVDKVLGTVMSGASFGEFGIIRQTPRTATVTAATKCSAMLIDKNSFLEILNLSNPEMVHKKCSFLLKLPIFQRVSRTILEHLSHVMALQNWKPFDFVYRRCRFSGFDDRLLVVLSGHVDVFVEPLLSDSELSQRKAKHDSQSCSCNTSRTLQESHSSSKLWLPFAKERGRCVCECGIGSFLNIHCLFRSDSPDCCAIAGAKGATVLVIQKIDFISIVEKGKSRQLFQLLAEQSWTSMWERRHRVSGLSFSKFPYRELVGQSILISRHTNDFNDSKIIAMVMKKFLSGPRHSKVFPPLDLHRIPTEKLPESLKAYDDHSSVGKEFPSLLSSGIGNSSTHMIAGHDNHSPRVSRAMLEANMLYPALRCDGQRHDHQGSGVRDCTSIFAIPAGNSTPFMIESAIVPDSDLAHLNCNYFEKACIKFSQDLKDVQSFLRQSDRQPGAFHSLNFSRNFTPRAPEMPQEARSLGIRGKRIIHSARSQD